MVQLLKSSKRSFCFITWWTICHYNILDLLTPDYCEHDTYDNLSRCHNKKLWWHMLTVTSYLGVYWVSCLCQEDYLLPKFTTLKKKQLPWGMNTGTVKTTHRALSIIDDIYVQTWLIILSVINTNFILSYWNLKLVYTRFSEWMGVYFLKPTQNLHKTPSIRDLT